jgi:hypothetical protein
MMNIEDGFFINTMGGCNHSQVAIFLNGGSDRGDEVRSPDNFFLMRMRMSAVDLPALTFFMIA